MYWVLGTPVVLLGKMKHAEALLQKRMVKYGDRPELVMAQDIVTRDGMYVGTARTIHDTHRKQRRILGERLRANALKDWAHPALLPELRLFCQRLTQNPERFVGIIKCLTINVMLNSTFAHGSIENIDNPLIARINHATDNQFTAQVQGRFWVDYVPFLQYLPTWLPGMGWKRLGLRWRDEVDTLYQELWDGTKKKVAEGKSRYPCLVENLLESQMHQLTEREGTTLGAAMVDAGTDTLTGTTVIL
jgi:hypothetical protein